MFNTFRSSAYAMQWLLAILAEGAGNGFFALHSKFEFLLDLYLRIFEFGFFFRWTIFLAFFGTAIPTVLFSIGIPKIGAAMSSVLMTVELPIAILTVDLVLEEVLPDCQILSIVILLGAAATLNYLKTGRF